MAKQPNNGKDVAIKIVCRLFFSSSEKKLGKNGLKLFIDIVVAIGQSGCLSVLVLWVSDFVKITCTAWGSLKNYRVSHAIQKGTH